MAQHTKEHVKESPKRLLALDIMRGITIAGMILVNNPVSWSNIYAPLVPVPLPMVNSSPQVWPLSVEIRATMSTSPKPMSPPQGR